MIRMCIRAVLTCLVVMMLASCSTLSADWRTASRESAGIASDPAVIKNASIEVYAADAFSWRGWFAVHTWIAIKPQGAAQYTVFEVVGWGVDEGLPALRSFKTTTPDRYWFGARPERILHIEGEKATRLLPQITAAIAKYPWANEYTVIPGPNSNTFPTWLGLQVPELGLKMPFNAIGSGYADN